MRTYKLEEISEIVGGILTKVSDASIDKLRPPLLSDETSLALALSEEEIENIAKTQAKVALVPLGVNFEHISTIEVERPRLAMMKLLHLFYDAPATTIYHPKKVQEKNRSGLDLTAGMVYFLEVSIC